MSKQEINTHSCGECQGPITFCSERGELGRVQCVTSSTSCGRGLAFQKHRRPPSLQTVLSSQPAPSGLSCGLSPSPHTHFSCVSHSSLSKKICSLFWSLQEATSERNTEVPSVFPAATCWNLRAALTSHCGLKSVRPAARRDLSSPPLLLFGCLDGQVTATIPSDATLIYEHYLARCKLPSQSPCITS